MGADGHIAIFDLHKVLEIAEDINKTIRKEDSVYWPGYKCDWACNGKQACLIYWGDNIFVSPFENIIEFLKDQILIEKWKLFEARCWDEAILVHDQEVWT